MSQLEFTSHRMQLAGGAVDLTKKRILAAAELVFSRDGFQGATTREIARQAGVNEVTLFLSKQAYGLTWNSSACGR
jgi:AcrR family transcriptional regulator